MQEYGFSLTRILPFNFFEVIQKFTGNNANNWTFKKITEKEEHWIKRINNWINNSSRFSIINATVNDMMSFRLPPNFASKNKQIRAKKLTSILTEIIK